MVVLLVRSVPVPLQWYQSRSCAVFGLDVLHIVDMPSRLDLLFVVSRIGTDEVVIGIVMHLVCPYRLVSPSEHKISLLSLVTMRTTCPYRLESPSGLTVCVTRLGKATDPSCVCCYRSTSRECQYD